MWACAFHSLQWLQGKPVALHELIPMLKRLLPHLSGFLPKTAAATQTKSPPAGTQQQQPASGLRTTSSCPADTGLQAHPTDNTSDFSERCQSPLQQQVLSPRRPPLASPQRGFITNRSQPVVLEHLTRQILRASSQDAVQPHNRQQQSMPAALSKRRRSFDGDMCLLGSGCMPRQSQAVLRQHSMELLHLLS